MKLVFSSRALRDYLSFSKIIQRTADKQFAFLIKSLTHPSLRSKKYDESRDIWQARVNKDHRFYFQIKKDTYFILAILKHPK